MTVPKPTRYIAYRWPTGEVMVVDVDSEGEWRGGTQAEYDNWNDAWDKWDIAMRNKERPLPQEFAHRAVAGSKLLSHVCWPR